MRGVYHKFKTGVTYKQPVIDPGFVDYVNNPTYNLPVMKLGGQNPPVYTNNRYDPRLQHYQDSLYVHNLQEEKLRKLYNTGINYAGYPIDLSSHEQLPSNNSISYKGMSPDYIDHFKTIGSPDSYYTGHFKAPVQPIIYRKPQPMPVSGEGDYSVVQIAPERRMYRYPTQQQADSAANSVLHPQYRYGGYREPYSVYLYPHLYSQPNFY